MAKSHAEGRTVQTALDGLPYGEIGSGSSGRIKRPPLPEGVTNKRLIRDVAVIAAPSLVELILTQLTSMADQIMVGRLPGEEGVMALAAVGIAMQPKFLLMTMIQAMNVGATAVIARCRGQNNRERANLVFKHALILNFIMSTLFMVIGLFSGEWLIRFMSSEAISAQTLAYGTEYLRIQMYGFIPLCMGFTVTAALRGIGDTKTPMVYNTVANVVNFIFNYLMIYGHGGFPRMGVAGASWATIIGQTVAFFIAVGVALGKRHYVYLDLKTKFKFDRKIMSNVISIGMPSMIEQLFMRAGIIIYNRTVASLGDTMYATHHVCINIQALSFMIGQATANAATTLMGQSLGKRREDMAVIYVSVARRLGIAISMVVALIFVLFGRQIVGLYNNTEDVIIMGGQILMLIAATQPFQADQFIVSGGLRGAGDTRYTAIVMFITVIGVRSGLALLLVNVLDLGLWGAWIALALDQLIRSLLMSLRYTSGKWKARALAIEVGNNANVEADIAKAEAEDEVDDEIDAEL